MKMIGTVERIRWLSFELSFFDPKVQRANEDLHKTSTWLAEQARNVERAMERKRWER